jgi:hypothetical protein
MIKQQILKLLEGKDHPVLVSRQVLNTWKSPKTNPNLNTVEKIIKENDFEVFISDGNLNDLIAFNKRFAEKHGYKMNLVFEV